MSSHNLAATPCAVRFLKPRIDPVSRQAELDAVVSLGNERRYGIEDLGPFSVAPARSDSDYTYFTQIRAVPLSFNGYEFRFDMPPGEFGEYDFGDEVETMLKEAAGFCRLGDLSEFIGTVKAMIAERIAPASRCLDSLRLIAIGVQFNLADGSFGLVADLERLGRDLKPGIDRITGRDLMTLEDKLTSFVAEHLERAKLRVSAAASRAVGWIDAAAVNIVEASGIAISDAIARLRGQQTVEFTFIADGAEHSAALHWDNGVIRGEIDGVDGLWTLSGELMKMLNPGLPEVIFTAWAGRRFGEVVESRFIPADAIVTGTWSVGEWIYVEMVIGSRFIAEAAGGIRDPDCIG